MLKAAESYRTTKIYKNLLISCHYSIVFGGKKPINRRDMQVILVMLLFITKLTLHEIEMCVVSHTSVIYNIDKTNLSSIIT